MGNVEARTETLARMTNIAARVMAIVIDTPYWLPSIYVLHGEERSLGTLRKGGVPALKSIPKEYDLSRVAGSATEPGWGPGTPR